MLLNESRVAIEIARLVPNLLALVVGCMIPLLLRDRPYRPFPPLNSRQLAAQIGATLTICWASFGVSLVLFLAYGIGRKGQEAGTQALAYLTKVNPSFICISLATITLVKYHAVMRRSQVYLAIAYLLANGSLIVAGGSKQGFALVLFAWFVTQLVTRNDFKMAKKTFIYLQAAVVVAIFIAFPLSRFVKGSDTLGTAILRFRTEMTPAASLALVTQRISGFDGQIVVSEYRPRGLVRAYNPRTVASNIVSRLVPGTRARYMTTGAAVGVYYHGMPKSHRFGGGVGVFSSLTLMFGAPLIPSLILGFSLSSGFLMLRHDPHSDRMAVAMYCYLYFVINSLIGGNFGSTIAHLVVSLVHTFGLFKLIEMYGTKRGLSSV